MKDIIVLMDKYYRTVIWHMLLITFNSVQRTQSGLYQLNVSNIAGYAIGGFILNIKCKCY